MIKYYSVNGQIIPKEEACLNVTDLAIHRGYGIFDYFLIKQGHPLFFEEYISRMVRSAEALMLPLPFSVEKIKSLIYELIEANQIKSAGIKLVLTGGYSEDGYAPSKPNLVMLMSAIPTYPDTKYSDGVKLILHEYHRTFPSTKSINYIMGVRLLPQTKAAGADDVLFHYGGYVHETTRANFFIIKEDNTIVTAGDKILFGITRKKTLEIARKHYRVEERDIEFMELESAAEAFITSTTKQVMPIVQVSDIRIGNGQPGPITKQFLSLFREMETEYLVSKVNQVK